MPAPESIVKLVDQFDRNKRQYMTARFNESETRGELIDRFFEALGWDVHNRAGVFQKYKDVLVEGTIKIHGESKAPDYCFRIGGDPVFFVEAKKPSVNIKNDPHPAFQVRRYAWSEKLALSILTDFEELAVYDCRVKPAKTDSASTARIKFFTYTDYVEKWDEIAGVFSREAVLQGSFHRYTESAKHKGTTEVDAAFLAEIESWRDELAKDIARRNKHLDVRGLNFAVQRIIDRIVFLRIAEDRGLEEYGQLRDTLKGGDVYAQLTGLFLNADNRYNSGLFHFKKEKNRAEGPDELTLSLDVGDKPLKDIFSRLYYPDSPYVFSRIPTEILGQVYEQFLGKVIRLTAGHQAKVEERPEVRKAGGVYYTPEYIVEYIVQQTVGKLVEGKTPDEVAALTVLDPACGSGSFLLGAYQFLLDWHLKWYIDHTPTALIANPRPRSRVFEGPGTSGVAGSTSIIDSGPATREVPDPALADSRRAEDEGRKKTQRAAPPPIIPDGAGGSMLTIDERKRILLNNIYGVDIDPQAVEVTKLSLLLKVLEGVKAARTDLGLDRLLPDLGSNIKCGNSLIGSDFYSGNQFEMLSQEENRRINVFDWDREWPEIMGRGGFHAVIGNPPYVRQEMLGDFKAYFQTHYQTYAGTADLYTYFIERGMALLREGGKFGIIVANKWMRANYGKPLREWMKTKCIEEITDFGDLPVFTGATTYPCILLLSNSAPEDTFNAATMDTLEFSSLAEHVHSITFTMKREGLDDNGWALVDGKVQDLLDHLRAQGKPLGEYVQGKIYRGVLTGLNKAFVIDSATKEKLVASDPKSADILKPFLAGRDIKRYAPLHTDKWLILFPAGWTNKQYPGRGNKWNWLKQEYPAIATHLEPYAVDAEKRWDKGDYWWELRSCAYYDEFEKPKMMLPDITLKGNVMLDSEGSYYSVNTTYIIGSDSLYLLGLLNSSVINFFYRNLASSYRGGYVRYIYQYMEQIPIIEEHTNPAIAESIAANAGRMLELHAQHTHARTDFERTNLHRQIKAADREMDKAVGMMYGVGEAELDIVEGK